jgi:hypothetical protein
MESEDENLTVNKLDKHMKMVHEAEKIAIDIMQGKSIKDSINIATALTAIIFRTLLTNDDEFKKVLDIHITAIKNSPI